MSPLQIWCNEAQERYVLLINKESMNRFVSVCRRERSGFSDVGVVVAKEADGVPRLVLTDRESREYPRPIDVPMNVLFPAGRKLDRVVESKLPAWPSFNGFESLTAAIGGDS